MFSGWSDHENHSITGDKQIFFVIIPLIVTPTDTVKRSPLDTV